MNFVAKLVRFFSLPIRKHKGTRLGYCLSIPLLFIVEFLVLYLGVCYTSILVRKCILLQKLCFFFALPKRKQKTTLIGSYLSIGGKIRFVAMKVTEKN